MSWWRALLCGIGLHDKRTTNWLRVNWHVECLHCGRGWVKRIEGDVRFDRPHARRNI